MSRSIDEFLSRMRPPPPRFNGWWLLSWLEFQRQFDRLLDEVERLAAKDPTGYGSHPQARLLATIVRLVTRDIPRDPGHSDFRQGGTLGDDYTSWRRAKFHQRFRLFFRYRSAENVIVYTWVNTESGLRKSGDRTDPYNVFRRMLERGSPPNDFEELVRESQALKLPGSGPGEPAAEG